MYTGQVTVGGSADVRELPAVVISKLAVGDFDNNAYLLRCRSTGEQLLVDAAAEPQRLLDLIGPGGVVGVLTTHAHRDHWSALADVLAATGAPHLAGAIDADDIDVPTDVRLADGDTVRFGDVVLDVIHLRGHTPGSIALIYDDPEGPPHVFTGDCLFPGGIGRTTTSEDFDSLIGDVTARLFDVLPDETWVYPGHGFDTTLGAERPALDEWRARRW